jgi:hypothetical protein
MPGTGGTGSKPLRANSVKPSGNRPRAGFEVCEPAENRADASARCGARRVGFGGMAALRADKPMLPGRYGRFVFCQEERCGFVP